MSERLKNVVASWERTPGVRERLHGDPRYEEPDGESGPVNGLFAGRPVIGRDTPINGGVYLGALPREAIVVDDSRDKRRYDMVYYAALRAVYAAAEDEPDLPVLGKVLVPVFTEIRRAMPYDSVGVSELTHGMRDHKINLASFLKRRAGVCRHQALLSGYVLERMKNEGELMEEDRVSIDRNGIKGLGGHAWTRYTASDSTVYIADPAQRVVGRLDRLDDTIWDYRRPED